MLPAGLPSLSPLRAIQELSMNDLIARRERALGPGMRLFYEQPFEPVDARGVWITDVDGKRYLDAYNNVPHVGHAHPRVVAAVQARMASVNTNTRYLDPHVLDYAEALKATMPAELDTVMLTCSGTEANDLAWRLACAHTGGSGAIATSYAYHGNSTMVSALDVVSTPSGKNEGWVATVDAPIDRSAEDGDSEAGSATFDKGMAAAIETLTANKRPPAAFYFDPLFASDGVRLPAKGAMEAGLERLRKQGGLVVSDEVQPGFGRLGEAMWGFEAVGVMPDIVTMGKATGNGYPLGVVVTRREIVQSFRNKGRYFNTFGGSPAASAAGAAVLDVLSSEGLQANARAVGADLKAALIQLGQRHRLITDVRGTGFFLGVELAHRRGGEKVPATAEARRAINLLWELGVLVGLTGPGLNVLKVRPPMVFGKDDAAILLDRFDQAMGRV
ncbi:aminotransferase class III-fold pyridoxal phosphate-dependent enzyme [Bradyrhizobium sp.]|uniref:aminotransferase class III-fold pyridoxal phosphate-dependent enzyme n=1 Tax=Bradyrhizobium sp. TaxID=376 RepID=UPI0039E61FCF